MATKCHDAFSCCWTAASIASKVIILLYLFVTEIMAKINKNLLI